MFTTSKKKNTPATPFTKTYFLAWVQARFRLGEREIRSEHTSVIAIISSVSLLFVELSEHKKDTSRRQRCRVLIWRRKRDSNSRNRFAVYTISSRAPSTKLGDFSIPFCLILHWV